MQLIAYVHLNPVAAGLVTDPARYDDSGHRELLGRPGHGLLEAAGVLALFAATEKAARRAYQNLLRSCATQPWAADAPGRLPRWGRDVDRAVEAEPLAPRLDPLGRGGGRERVRLDIGAFVQWACEALGVPPDRVLRGSLDRAVVRQRQLLAGLAVERWRVGAGALARLFGRRPEVVTRWAKRVGERRVDEVGFKELYESLAASLAARAAQSRP